MKLALRRIWLSYKFILEKAATWTAAFYALAGLLSFFVSFEGLFNNEATFWNKFWISVGVLAGVFLQCAVVWITKVLCQKKNRVVEGHNGKGVYLLYGDLFDPMTVHECSVAVWKICLRGYNLMWRMK